MKRVGFRLNTKITALSDNTQKGVDGLSCEFHSTFCH